MTIDFAKLSAPFPADRVSWRVGSTTQDKSKGMALAYIDARDVMERLDEVCGPAGWQCDYPHANGKTVCRLGLRIGDEWIWKADGAGDTDHEAEKGALSDAFKRAAVRWGVGRYLYDLDSPWVEIEPRGKSFVIKQGEYQKLRGLLTRSGAPARQTPAPHPGEAAAVEALKLGMDTCDTADQLAGFWKEHWPQIKHLTDRARDEVTAHKDARKAQLTQKEAA